MKKFFLIIGLLIVSHAQAESLRVLTWNVFMLPKPIKWSMQEERAKTIINEISKRNNDVVVLQEAFDWKFQAQLRMKLRKQYPYQFYLGRKFVSFTVYGSGVYYLSKYPFKNVKNIFFNDCGMADCLASKGTALLEFKFGNKNIQIASTHMQAGGQPKYVQVRSRQLSQIKNMFQNVHRAGVPQFLIGDLNIDGLLDEEYLRALDYLEMSSTPLEGELPYSNGFPTLCYSKPGDDNRQWLDHVFVRGNGSVSEKKVIPFYGKFRNRTCALSDHHGVEAVLNF